MQKKIVMIRKTLMISLAKQMSTLISEHQGIKGMMLYKRIPTNEKMTNKNIYVVAIYFLAVL
jgi:hypothetical protein